MPRTARPGARDTNPDRLYHTWRAFRLCDMNYPPPPPSLAGGAEAWARLRWTPPRFPITNSVLYSVALAVRPGQS